MYSTNSESGKGFNTFLKVTSAVTVLAVFCLVVSLAVHPVDDRDIWMHLKAGMTSLAEGRILSVDEFSYTAAGREWVNHQWLSQIVFYTVWAMSGENGLILFTVLALAACFAVMFVTGRRAGAAAAGVCILFSVIAASERFLVRPEIFTFFFLCVYLFVIFEEKNRLFWFLPLLQAVWANMHAGCVYGIGLAAAYAAGSAFERMLKPETGKRPLWHYLLLTALLACATLANPFGWKVLAHGFTLAESGILTDKTAEWAGTFGYRPFASHALLCYKLLLVLSGATFLLGKRKGMFPLLFVWLGFLVLSVSARRNVALFALVAGPIAAVNLSYAGGNIAAWWRSSFLRPAVEVLAPVLATVVCFAMIAGIMSGKYYFLERSPRRFGFGTAERVVPERALEFIDGIPFRGNILNEHGFGGSMIWRLSPLRRVFIDGRSVLHGARAFEFYGRVMKGGQDFDRAVEQYGISCVLLDHTMPSSEGLLLRLLGGPPWRPVFVDEMSIIFAAAAPGEKGPLPEAVSLTDWHPSQDRKGAWEYPWKKLNAAHLFFAAGQHEKAERFFKAALEQNPLLPEAHNALAAVYGKQGDLVLAQRSAGEALEMNPEYADAVLSMGNIMMAKREYGGAAGWYEKAVRLDNASRAARYNLAVCYAALRRVNEAVDIYVKLKEEDPQDLQVRINLGNLYGKCGLYPLAIEQYKEAMKIEPGNPHIYYNMSITYLSAGDTAKAREYREKALSLSPEIEESGEKRRIFEELLDAP